MAQRSRSQNVVVQIKVKLLGVTKPPVWRRLQVHADTRLDELHAILVAALGWQDSHMHCFTSGAEEFGEPNPDLDFTDERRVSLAEVIDGAGDRLGYTYDFGDNWEHEIVVEEVLQADRDTHYPILLAAKGACPPEDCGGPWGYAELKEILADPTHERHEEMLEWLGLDDHTGFDPAAVAADDAENQVALIAQAAP